MKRSSSASRLWQGKPGPAGVYSAVRGKVVDRIEHQFAQDRLYLHICFGDKTEMSFTLSSRLVIEEAVLTDMSTGDSKPIKEYGSYEG
jgi:hypothetical protein